jgi:hypothetical protein
MRPPSPYPTLSPSSFLSLPSVGLPVIPSTSQWARARRLTSAARPSRRRLGRPSRRRLGRPSRQRLGRAVYPAARACPPCRCSAGSPGPRHAHDLPRIRTPRAASCARPPLRDRRPNRRAEDVKARRSALACADLSETQMEAVQRACAAAWAPPVDSGRHPVSSRCGRIWSPIHSRRLRSSRRPTTKQRQ